MSPSHSDVQREEGCVPWSFDVDYCLDTLSSYRWPTTDEEEKSALGNLSRCQRRRAGFGGRLSATEDLMASVTARPVRSWRGEAVGRVGLLG